MATKFTWAILLLGLVLVAGCQHPEVTAVSLNPHLCPHKFAFIHDPCKEPEGIPFYLPKPLLIISKNFRNIEETKVGLTNGAPIPNYFDDQAKYADVNARTNFSGPDSSGSGASTNTTTTTTTFPSDGKNLATAAPANIYSSGGAPVSPGAVAPDGLKPEAFFTYHIVFVPDLTQKYGLKIRGGVGEIRAAMNLVNGWQFTGLGPYYMKDSSTAQNTLAGGITANLAASGVADVVKAVANLKPGGAAPAAGAKTSGAAFAPLSTDQVTALADAMRQLNPKFLTIPAYSEISIYEPYLSPEGTMEWKQIANQKFDRDVVATDFTPQQVISMLTQTNPVAVPSLATESPSNPPPAPTAPVVNPVDPNTNKPVDANVPKPPDPNAPKPADPNAPKPADPTTTKPKPPAAEPPKALNSADPSPSESTKPKSGAEDLQLVPTPPGPSLPGPGEGGAELNMEGPRVSLAPRAKTDAAIVRTQTTTTAAPSRRTPILQTLQYIGGPEAPFPVFMLPNPPLNATLQLVRDGKLVIPDLKSAAVKTPLVIQDNQPSPPESGFHQYLVQWVRSANDVVPIAGATIEFEKPEKQTTPEPPAAPAPTVATALSSDLTRLFGSQIAAISAPRAGGASPAAPSIPPTAPPVATTPVAGTSNGNNVTVNNQLFGRPSLGTARDRLSWLRHHKKRSSVRELDFGALDAEVPPPTSLVPVPTSPSPTPQPSPKTLNSANPDGTKAKAAEAGRDLQI